MHNAGGDELLRTLYYAILAAVGGLLGYAMRTISAKRKLSLTRAVIEAASSGFVGVITMLLCKAVGLDEAWTGAIVGVFGWMGASASFAVIEKQVMKRLGMEDKS